MTTFFNHRRHHEDKVEDEDHEVGEDNDGCSLQGLETSWYVFYYSIYYLIYSLTSGIPPSINSRSAHEKGPERWFHRSGPRFIILLLTKVPFSLQQPVNGRDKEEEKKMRETDNGARDACLEFQEYFYLLFCSTNDCLHSLHVQDCNKNHNHHQ